MYYDVNGSDRVVIINMYLLALNDEMVRLSVIHEEADKRTGK